MMSWARQCNYKLLPSISTVLSNQQFAVTGLRCKKSHTKWPTIRELPKPGLLARSQLFLGASAHIESILQSWKQLRRCSQLNFSKLVEGNQNNKKQVAWVEIAQPTKTGTTGPTGVMAKLSGIVLPGNTIWFFIHCGQVSALIRRAILFQTIF